MRTPRNINASSTASNTSLGSANFISGLTVFVVGWVSLNGLAAALGYRALDPPPFAWLAGAVSLASLYLVILILTTQRGDDRLTQRRELLNLELTILGEQKIAKVVALLEELRQGSPHLRNRVDELAETMSQPADPQSVIDAIKETRSEFAHVSRKAEGVLDEFIVALARTFFVTGFDREIVSRGFDRLNWLADRWAINPKICSTGYNRC